MYERDEPFSRLPRGVYRLETASTYIGNIPTVSSFLKHSCVITLPMFGYRYKRNSYMKLSETKEAVASFIDHY